MTPRRILLAATLVAAPSLSTAVAAFGSAPPASADTAELPRSLTYAGTQWTIESAAFDPGAGDAPPTVRLDFSVVSQQRPERRCIQLTATDAPAPRQSLGLLKHLIGDRDRCLHKHQYYRV